MKNSILLYAVSIFVVLVGLIWLKYVSSNYDEEIFGVAIQVTMSVWLIMIGVKAILTKLIP